MLVVLRPVVWAAAIAAGGSILYLLPRTTGTTWDEIGRTLSRVSFTDVLLLSGLWGLALFCYSFVLTGSLPGLRRRRAMTLNLTGSAVSNVAPLGGAWGVGLNALMLRRWGYAGKDIASFMMISNIWNVLAKLAVSAVVIGLLAVGGVSVPLSAHGARAVVISAAVAVLLIVLCLTSRAGVHRRRLVGRPGGQRRPARVPGAPPHLAAHPAARRTPGDDRGGPGPLAADERGHGALPVPAGCCCSGSASRCVGNEFTFAAVLTAFAVDRLLTAVPLTPGAPAWSKPARQRR